MSNILHSGGSVLRPTFTVIRECSFTTSTCQAATTLSGG